MLEIYKFLGLSPETPVFGVANLTTFISETSHCAVSESVHSS
jgi:hypothetical protein